MGNDDHAYVASTICMIIRKFYLQFGIGVPSHFPSLHVPFMHLFPVSHAFLFGVCTQPTFGSHLSSVHGFLSSQLTGVRTHLPLTHFCSVKHLLLGSPHVPVFGLCT